MSFGKPPFPSETAMYVSFFPENDGAKEDTVFPSRLTLSSDEAFSPCDAMKSVPFHESPTKALLTKKVLAGVWAATFGRVRVIKTIAARTDGRRDLVGTLYQRETDCPHKHVPRRWWDLRHG